MKKKLKALFYPNVDFKTLYIPFIYKEIYFDGIYNDVFNQKKPNSMTVVDIGANIGVVTQHMQPYAKRLFAVEPSSEHFRALKKNVEFNDWDNVTPIKAAIADKDGEMEMTRNDENLTCNSIVLKYEGKKEMVKTLAMDTFFKEHKIEKVDFMKFDVEGAEDLILRSEGFKKVAKKIKAIMVEFHFPNWQDLVAYMVDLGFEARRYQSSAIIVMFTRP